MTLPACEEGHRRCESRDDGPVVIEQCFWDALSVVRQRLEESRGMVDILGRPLVEARDRLDGRRRRPREDAPRIAAVHEAARRGSRLVPPELKLSAGTATTLRGGWAGRWAISTAFPGGALLAAAADLLGSTSVIAAAEGFPAGVLERPAQSAGAPAVGGRHLRGRHRGDLLGVAGFGHHVGIGSSYGAFLAPLGHVAARLHGIGSQARRAVFGLPFGTMVLVRARRPEDRRGRAHPRRSAGPPAPTGQLPARGRDRHSTPWEPQEILAAPARRWPTAPP